MSRFEESTASAAEVEAAETERGVTVHLVDGSAVTTKAAALDAIAAALSFPDWFGKNLDALYDCLRDLSWLPSGEHALIWAHADRLRDADATAFRGIRSALRDAVAADRNTRTTLTVVLTPN